MTPTLDTLISQSEAQVIAKAGQPLRKTDENGWVVWWYGAKSQSRADYVYFRDGAVAIISQSRNDKPELVGKYVGLYGIPEKTYQVPQAGTDSLQEVVYAWPGKGKSVLVTGYDQTGLVIREETFAPTTVAQFEASGSAGSRYSAFTGTTVSPDVFSGAIRDYRLATATPVIFVVLAVLLLILVVAAVRKLRKH